MEENEAGLRIPPTYDEILITLAEECAYLSGIVRPLIDGIKRGDSSRKLAYFLAYNWEIQKERIDSARKTSLIEAERVRLVFGKDAGEKLEDRSYIDSLSLMIFSDIANALATPSFNTCYECGKQLSGSLNGEFCEGCEEFFCKACFESHNCE